MAKQTKADLLKKISALLSGIDEMYTQYKTITEQQVQLLKDNATLRNMVDILYKEIDAYKREREDR